MVHVYTDVDCQIFLLAHTSRAVVTSNPTFLSRFALASSCVCFLLYPRAQSSRACKRLDSQFSFSFVRCTHLSTSLALKRWSASEGLFTFYFVVTGPIFLRDDAFLEISQSWLLYGCLEWHRCLSLAHVGACGRHDYPGVAANLNTLLMHSLWVFSHERILLWIHTFPFFTRYSFKIAMFSPRLHTDFISAQRDWKHPHFRAFKSFKHLDKKLLLKHICKLK
jgi:hypothetical protein